MKEVGFEVNSKFKISFSVKIETVLSISKLIGFQYKDRKKEFFYSTLPYK